MDEIRAELKAIAAEAATLIDRRNDAVLRARAAGMKWPEISAIVGITPHGLRKSLHDREAQQ